MKTLGDALPEEIERNKELLKQYKALGPCGSFAYALINYDILVAEEAIAKQDLVKMIQIYKKLKYNE